MVPDIPFFLKSKDTRVGVTTSGIVPLIPLEDNEIAISVGIVHKPAGMLPTELPLGKPNADNEDSKVIESGIRPSKVKFALRSRLGGLSPRV
jgi:hypothetical protein